MIRNDIRKFGKIKLFLALPLMALGLFGLILPIIPGLPFLALGLVLLIPSLEHKLKDLLVKK